MTAPAPAVVPALFAPSTWTWTPARTAAAVLLTAAGTAALVLRQVGVPATDTIWAEDGGRFLQLALDTGPLGSVAEPYAGYLHLAPRLVAELASALPLSWAADVFTLSTDLVAVLGGVLVFVAASGHLRRPAVRLALAATVPLLPIAGDEIAHSIANLQWWLLFPALWALLWVPTTRSGLTVSSLWLVVTTLSAPLAVVLAPLALLRVAWLRGRQRLPAVAYLVGLVVQAAAVVLAETTAAPTPDPATVAQAYGQRVAGAVLAGHEGSAQAWLAFGDLWVWAAVVVVTGIVVAGLLRRDVPRWVVAGCGAASVAVFVLSVGLRDVTRFLAWTGDAVGTDGGRYTVVPALFLYAVIALVLDRRPERGSRAWDALTVVVGLGLLAQVVVGYHVVNARTPGPSWDVALAEARATCVELPDDARVKVPIAPQPGWAVRIGCDRLR